MNEDNKEVQEKVDTNDYKELYGKLRNYINTSRDGYRAALIQTKEQIETFKSQLAILELKKNKLEGAIEVSNDLLKAVLPSNNKK